jgi:hypothetical protein
LGRSWLLAKLAPVLWQVLVLLFWQAWSWSVGLGSCWLQLQPEQGQLLPEGRHLQPADKRPSSPAAIKVCNTPAGEKR